MVTDRSLEGSQKALHNASPTVRDGKIRNTMNIDPEVYNNALEANREMMGGGNIWKEKEFCRDMMRRHPELCPPKAKSLVFNMNPERVRTRTRNRLGRVQTRIWYRGNVRYELDEGAEVIRTLDKVTGEAHVYDLDSGEEIEV